MGVHGLWQLLDPLGHPVNLESLQNKVLAVDASILLHQSIHGFRDAQGTPLANAHLLGLFHRVCKLLFYNIKPVFIFDGAVPELKKRTLAARKDKQDIAAKDVEKTRRQILNKYLQKKSVKDILNAKKLKPAELQFQSKDLSLPSTSYKSDLFELPPIPPQLNTNSYMSSESEDEIDGAENSRRERALQNLDEVDFESPNFKILPLEIQHEFLVELRERLKSRSWFKGEELPEDSEKIGSFQVQQLLARRKIRKRLDEVRKELASNLTGAIISSLDDNELGSQPEERFSVARRIVSEDFSHYLLFKNVRINKDKQEIKVTETDNQVKNESLAKALETTIEVDKVEEKIVSDGEDLANSESEISIVANEEDIAKWMQMPDDIYDYTDEVVLLKDGEKKSDVNLAKPNTDVSVIKSDIEPKINIEDKNDVETSFGTISTIKHSSESEIKTKTLQEFRINERNTRTEQKSQTEVQLLPNSSDVSIVGYRLNSVANTSSTFIVEESVASSSKHSEILVHSSDDEFLEVIVDSTKAAEDELFPIEIFKKFDYDQINLPVEVSTSLTEMEIPENKSEECNAVDEFLTNLPKSNAELQSFSENLDAEFKTLVKEKGRQERIAATITDQMYLEGQELLRQFGIPFIVSPAEAEAQCATLELLGLTEGTITEDSDIWLFGAKHVYKNFFEKGRDPLHFNAAVIKDRFDLDRSRLIAIAFLTGSDYTDGVKGLGVVKALELLAEFPHEEGYESLKSFRKWWNQAQTQKVAPSETKVKQNLRKIELNEGFPNEIVLKAYIEPLVDSSTEKFSWSSPDLDALRQFANIKLHWNREKTDSVLLPVMKKLSSIQKKQLQLSHFGFACSRDQQTISQPSKRLARALKKVRNITKNASNLKDNEKKVIKEVSRPKGERKRALSSVPQGQSRATAVPSGRSVHQRSANSKAKVQSVRDLELSETSDSSAEQSDDYKNRAASSKRKR